jgi:type I restriction enzyme, S subunit
LAFILGDAGMTSRLVKIGDFARVISGATPKTGIDEYWDGDIFWATPKDLSKFEGKYIGSTIDKITEAGCKSCSTVILPPNSVLLSSRAPIGHLAINSVPMSTNQGFKSLILDPSLADSSYIFYWLRSNREFLNSLGRGATFKEISKSIVQEIEIPLPPLEVQKRIASILDAADALRAKRRESLRKLEVLLKSVFLEMFGDPVTNSKNLPTNSLAEVINITTGKLDSNAAEENGIYPFFTCAKEISRINTFAFDCEAILLAGNNASADYDVKLYNGKFNAYQRTYVMTLSSNGISYPFLKMVLESNLLNLKNVSKGSNTKYLTLTILNPIPVPIPKHDDLKKFDLIYMELNQQSMNLQSSLASLETLFSSLQDQAFNGTLDSAAPLLAQLEVQTSLF